MTTRCKTCVHNHTRDLACVLCGCSNYVDATGDGVAEYFAHDTGALYVPGGLLAPEVACVIMDSLETWEHINHDQWDVAPSIGVLTAAQHTLGGRAVMTAMVHVAEIPYTMWEVVGDPRIMIRNFVNTAVQYPTKFDELRYLWCGLPRDQVVIAWFFSVEALVRDKATGEVTDEERRVIAVDVDDRHYHLSRTRITNDVERRIATLQMFKADCARAAAERGEDPKDVFHDGLPRLNSWMQQLTRATTQEQTARVALAGIKP